MGICGIIAEYDPLHNGHAWQLTEARRLTGADLVICSISGSFTQRGMPALLSAHTRAAMALHAGADLALQPPFSYSVCNGERFALGGVTLLKRAGADALCFGVEPAGLSYIGEAADILEKNDAAFRRRLRALLDSGLSFPKAQGEALADILRLQDPGILAQPNTALAICYARANIRLQAGLTLYPVPRSGQYHDEALPGPDTLPSATAVRKAALAGRWEQVQAAMPAAAFALMREAFAAGKYHPPGALDALLRWKLRQQRDFSMLPDLSEGIENRLHMSASALTREDMIQAVKSKRYSHARISRLLTHALIGTDGRRLSALPEYGYVLGFRGNASHVLKKAEKEGFPFLPSAIKDASGEEMTLDIRADDLWQLGAEQPFGGIFREKPVIV